MAIFCTRCGTELPDVAHFCSNCGVAVVSAGPRRPLVRPRIGRQVAGVCIGLSQTYGWDLALVRVVAVGITICTGLLVGLVAYLACWIGIPEEPLPTPPGEYSQKI
jgi:phage shock protein PspC (stress-responsive transcriptional regulator)